MTKYLQLRISELLLTSYDVMLFCCHLSGTYEYYNDGEIAVAVGLCPVGKKVNYCRSRNLPTPHNLNKLFVFKV